jgi:L-asparaginase/Glu-tRNA(Gln) amidotransferase subunit D
MFSENASYALWNALTTKLDEVIYKYFHANANPDGMIADQRMIDLYAEERRQYEAAHLPGELTEKMFRDDFSGRYILGIVLHFGTDTLVLAATALALSLQHLPCPIVITGANQPPREENLAARRGQAYVTSDAWANLMNTIYFLQSFGHRLTEIFVCFGETVHNAINLRKRGKEIIPSGHGGRTPRHVEPFAFRNLSQRGQYMFRLIDGLFCNNYYPNPIHYDMVFDRKEFGDLRHIRFDAVSREPPKPTVTESFRPRVVFVEVNPCFPIIDLQTMVSEGLYVVVAQGYASGTYPSAPSHPFARLLDDAHRLGVPIVLVSRYGILPSQQEYAVANPSTDHATVLPLYQIIGETAVPLLSLITSRIADEKWARRSGEDADATLHRRKQLLTAGVGELFAERPNILSFELKNVADKGAMYAEMIDMQTLRNDQREQRRIEDDGTRTPRMNEATRALNAGAGDRTVLLSRHDVLQLLEELPHVFEKVEAGADGLDAVFNLGFDYGFKLWRACEAERPSTAQSESDELLTDGLDLFFDLQNEQIKKERLSRIREILAIVQATANDSGVMHVESLQVPKVGERKQTVAGDHGTPGSITVQFRIKRLEHGAHDERYAVMMFSEEERQFFEKLWQGPQDDQTAQFDHAMKDRYNALLRKTWTHTARTADWFIFGLSKGVAFGVAAALRIDHVASHAEADPRFLLWFRKMMKTSIRAADEHAWQIAYTCYELQQPDEEANQVFP